MNGEQLGDAAVRKTEHEKGGKILYWILGGLGLLAVGLIVGIVIVNLNKGDESNNACLKIEDEYEMRVCLDKLPDNEETDKAYVTAINRALNKGDYDGFEELVFDKAFSIVLDDGDCEEATKYLENEDWLAKLPDNEKLYFYNRSIGVAVDCGSKELEDKYTKKYYELYESLGVYDSDESFEIPTDEELDEMDYEEEEDDYEE